MEKRFEGKINQYCSGDNWKRENNWWWRYLKNVAWNIIHRGRTEISKQIDHFAFKQVRQISQRNKEFSAKFRAHRRVHKASDKLNSILERILKINKEAAAINNNEWRLSNLLSR